MAGIELDLNATDPEQLAKLFEQIESGEPPKEDPPKAEDVSTENAAQTQNEPTETVPQTQQQDSQTTDPGEPAGVATKDGKHVIPYSVLKSERDRASRAEQVAKEMADKVAALEAQVKTVSEGAKTGESARTEPPLPQVSELSPEDLEALKEDFPTVYKAVMASMAAAKALESKLKPVEDSVRDVQAERERSAAETVQEAIDSVPKLAHIQSANKEAFELAKQFDATLRTQAAWSNRSLSERFGKVIEMVEAALGPIEVAGQTARTSQPSAEELKNAAMAKAAQSARAARTNVPTSLSEFPAGQHAAQDEREAVEQLTPMQLAEKFSRMTPDQMDAYFQNL
jgi:hypothetical protein